MSWKKVLSLIKQGLTITDAIRDIVTGLLLIMVSMLVLSIVYQHGEITNNFLLAVQAIHYFGLYFIFHGWCSMVGKPMFIWLEILKEE